MENEIKKHAEAIETILAAYLPKEEGFEKVIYEAPANMV